MKRSGNVHDLRSNKQAQRFACETREPGVKRVSTSMRITIYRSPSSVAAVTAPQTSPTSKNASPKSCETDAMAHIQAAALGIVIYAAEIAKATDIRQVQSIKMQMRVPSVELEKRLDVAVLNLTL